MKFPYRKYISALPGSTDFQLISRPIINVRVASEHAEGNWEALVDTGADETLLPLACARLLRVELDQQLTSQAAGISGDLLQIHYGELEIEVGDGEESVAWKEIVGFVDLGADKDLIVLGHGGFLSYFTANFDGEREELELVQNSLLPGNA